MKDNCEFCNKKTDTEATSFVGNYCIDCHKILINQSREAIKKIKSRNKKFTCNQISIKQSEKEFKQALSNLRNPQTNKERHK